MACTSLTAYVNQCGDALRAGTKKVYMISFNDLEKATGSTDVYTMSAGVVSAITLDTGKKFVKVDVTPKSEGITETQTRAENGIITGTAGFSASLSGFNKESGAFVKGLLGQPVVVLAQLGSGKWVAVGLDGGFYLTESAGTHNATESGRNLTFGGDIYDSIPEVDATLIASLIS